MKLLIIHPRSGWILTTIAQKIKGASHDFCSREMPLEGGQMTDFPKFVDGIFYIDMQNCWNPFWRSVYPLGTPHIAMFTHLDKDSDNAMRPDWYGDYGPDGVVHMSQKYFSRFADNGWFPEDKMTVIRPGETKHLKIKKTKIGICQRGEHVGKGMDFLPQVLDSLSQAQRDGIELYFKGNGWLNKNDGGNCSKMVYRGAFYFGADKAENWFTGKYAGVDSVFYDSEHGDSYPLFYDKLDYLLVPSLWEGGPMSILEGLAYGLPIIAPDVGWVSEFNTIAHIYNTGNISSLNKVLGEIVDRKIKRHESIENISYTQYADDLVRFFERIKK